VDLVNQGGGVLGGLDVEAVQRGAGLGKIVDPLLRVRDHHVAVEEGVQVLGQA